MGDALRDRIQALCPDSFEDVYPYLAQMMSLPDEALPDGSPDLEGERLKSGIFDGVASMIEGAARECPLIVVCEDLHWADPTSIELLEQLLVLTERVPLLFICIFRPREERDCWRIREAAARLERHTDLRLDPLSAAESETLVGNLLRVEGLPQQLKERILGHSEGNPFYVEEILRSLIDSGAIAHDEATGRWRATRDVAEIAIPDTLHGVLMARIDRLQEDTKRVLQLASVIGRTFFHRVLAEIARQERALGEHLLALQREEMIRERARVPELAYIFKHHLTQKAAYTSLLKKERRVYHRQVAQALERLFSDNVEGQMGLLAYHWERAEEPEKAMAYLVRAGDRARLTYAHQEAIDFYQRALAFLREGEKYDQAARTLMKLGLTHHNAFDFGRSRQAYEESFALWQRAGEVQEETRSPLAPHALRVVWNEPLTLDPTMATDGVSALMIDQLFSGLVERSPEMNVTPGVAQRWEVLEGGRKYVFHLRDDVRWSDGAPVTAQDFEYAWVRALDPATASPIASLLYSVKGARAFHQGETPDPGRMGVRALDEVTLVVELEEPTGHFLSLVARCPCCYPLPRHAVAAHGEAWTQVGHIVTNGAFQVRSWQRGESMLLVRNPAYHGRVGGNVQRVALSFPTRPPSRLEVYQADDVDIVNLSGLPPADMDRARRQHAGEFVSVPDPATYYAGFDASRPPFDDPRVRRAFVQAADRETLVGVVQRGYYLPATGGFIPPGMPGHSPAIGLPYDPGKARQLLAKAGYPDGRGFPTVDWVVWRTTEAYREYLQAQWRENLGVEIASQSMEWGAYLARLDRELPHMFFMGWIADYPDPDVFLRVGIRQFQVGWRNQAYERLVEEARRVTDQGERIKLYQKADRILIKEAAIMPIAYSRSHLLVKPWVSKFPVAAVQDWFWKDLVVEPYKRL